MTAAAILQQVAAAGLRIQPTPDGKLWVTPKDRLTPNLAAAIKAHRAELLAILGGQSYALTAAQERQLRAWLASTGEDDPQVIEDTIARCRRFPLACAHLLRQARHAEARALLADHERAFVADADLDPVTVTVAVRGAGIVDVEISRERWDPFLFLQFLEGKRQ